MTVRQDLAASALTDLLFEEPGVGRCLVAPDGSVLRANAEWLRSTGFALDDVLGANILDLSPETRDTALALHARARAGQRVEVPRRAQTTNGRETWWEGSVAPVAMEGGTGLLITARDVTAGAGIGVGDRRRAEAELQQLASQRQLALDAAQMGWWHYDPVARAARYDERYAEIFGVSGHERGIDEILRLLHPEDLPRVWAAAEAALDPSRPKPYASEYRIVRPDGELRWIEAHGIATFEGEGAARHATSLVGTVSDITERKQAEEAIRTRDAQFQLLIEELHSGVALIDASGKFTLHNRRFLEMFGLSRDTDVENVNSQNWGAWEVFDEAGRLLHVDEHPVRKVALTGRPVRSQLVAVRPPTGGELTWMLVSAEPLFRKGGGVEQIICTYHEVTARRRAEEALRESEERYRLLFRNMLDGFAYCRMLYDERGRPEDFVYLAVNDSFTRLTALHEVEGRRVTEVIPGIREAHPELFEAYGRVARTGRPERFEIDFRPLGIWLAITVYRPHRDHFVAIFDDITERKRAEEALRQADRLKGEFLSAASHELRTPLTTLVLHTHGLLRMLEAGAVDERRMRGRLASMDGQLQRLNGLIGTLLDVSRISAGRLQLDRKPCDLARLAAEVVELFDDLAERSGAKFTLDASAAVGAWDVLRIEQVITNLLDNAVKHAPASPVEVTVARRGADAVLAVRDHGPGISKESQARIFQQYERAAEVRAFGGLGLGLWISRQIVEAHGGSISVESAPGQGATFTVRLPVEDR